LARSAPSQETAAAPGAALESASALLPCVGDRCRIPAIYSGLQNQELAYQAGQTIMIMLGQSFGWISCTVMLSLEASIEPEASSVMSDIGIWLSRGRV
jgi:hypothetical protein